MHYFCGNFKTTSFQNFKIYLYFSKTFLARATLDALFLSPETDGSGNTGRRRWQTGKLTFLFWDSNSQNWTKNMFLNQKIFPNIALIRDLQMLSKMLLWKV